MEGYRIAVISPESYAARPSSCVGGFKPVTHAPVISCVVVPSAFSVLASVRSSTLAIIPSTVTNAQGGVRSGATPPGKRINACTTSNAVIGSQARINRIEASFGRKTGTLDRGGSTPKWLRHASDSTGTLPQMMVAHEPRPWTMHNNELDLAKRNLEPNRTQHQTGTPFQAFSKINATASAFPSRIISSAVLPFRSGCGVLSQTRVICAEPSNS